MPKNRKRNSAKGAKSLSIRTKNKIGGRKSGKAVHQLPTSEVNNLLSRCRPRDKNKVSRENLRRILAGDRRANCADQMVSSL